MDPFENLMARQALLQRNVHGNIWIHVQWIHGFYEAHPNTPRPKQFEMGLPRERKHLGREEHEQEVKATEENTSGSIKYSHFSEDCAWMGKYYGWLGPDQESLKCNARAWSVPRTLEGQPPQCF